MRPATGAEVNEMQRNFGLNGNGVGAGACEGWEACTNTTTTRRRSKLLTWFCTRGCAPTATSACGCSFLREETMHETVKARSKGGCQPAHAAVCSEKPLACVCGPNSTSSKWFCFALPSLRPHLDAVATLGHLHHVHTVFIYHLTSVYWL